MQNHGPWKIRSSRDVYSDPWLRVQRDDVIRPDGKPGSYATVHLKSGVCVIAMDANRQVHLTSEFHYAVGRITTEGVSGGIEENETARGAAERELQEELGLLATHWIHLGRVDPFTAAILSTVDLYLAQDLSECPTEREGTELIERITLPLEEALDQVRRGQITHAPTCVALLRIALDLENMPQG